MVRVQGIYSTFNLLTPLTGSPPQVEAVLRSYRERVLAVGAAGAVRATLALRRTTVAAAAGRAERTERTGGAAGTEGVEGAERADAAAEEQSGPWAAATVATSCCPPLVVQGSGYRYDYVGARRTSYSRTSDMDIIGIVDGIAIGRVLRLARPTCRASELR